MPKSGSGQARTSVSEASSGVVCSTTTGSTASPVACAKRAGSRFCQTTPGGRVALQFDVAVVGMLTRPVTDDAARRRRCCGQLRARRTGGDPAAIHQHRAAVREDERRHDVIARPAVLHLVVDQDLVCRVERPGQRAPAGSAMRPPLADVLRQRRRRGQRSPRRIARAARPSAPCVRAATRRRRRTARSAASAATAGRKRGRRRRAGAREVSHRRGKQRGAGTI